MRRETSSPADEGAREEKRKKEITKASEGEEKSLRERRVPVLVFCVVVSGNRWWPVRESQKAESQSCRLPKARTPRESKQNRSSRIRSTAGQSELPTILYLIFLLFSPSLSLPAHISLSLLLRTTSLKHSNAFIQRFWKRWWTKRRRTRTRSTACRKSIFHVIIRTVHERNSASPSLSSLLSRGRKSEADSHCRVTTMVLRNGKTFTEKERGRERGEGDNLCEKRFKIPTIWRMRLEQTRG